jgi:hypothetical protein
MLKRLISACNVINNFVVHKKSQWLGAGEIPRHCLEPGLVYH